MSHFFLSCKQSKIESPRSFYGSFCIGPFNESQSLTVANALRRTLLSELIGIAITSVEIEGVTHEYSTLPGVRDSVFDILLNLKEIILKSNMYFKNTQIAYLNVRGPGVVRACDLKLPASIQCIDPDQYIATLSEDGFLNMKLKINQGKNYIIQNPKTIILDTKYPNVNRVKISQNDCIKKILLSKEKKNSQSRIGNLNKPSLKMNENTEIKKSEMQICKNYIPGVKNTSNKLSANQVCRNSIPKTDVLDNNPVIKDNSNKLPKTSVLDRNPLLIDAIFMPVTKVNYIIERDYLSEQRNLETNTSSHIIILEIWTNGSLHPREALYKALQNLTSLFSGLETIKILNSLSRKYQSLPFDKYRQIYKKIKYNYDYYKNVKKALKNLDLESEILPESIIEYEKQYRKKILNEWNTIFHVNNILGRNTLKNSNEKDNFEKNSAKQSSVSNNNNKWNYIDIGNLNLSLRTYTCLRNSNIHTLEDLLQYSPKTLLEIRNFGKKSLQEVEKSLEEIGLKLTNK